jgi:hypothetical protein
VVEPAAAGDIRAKDADSQRHGPQRRGHRTGFPATPWRGAVVRRIG